MAVRHLFVAQAEFLRPEQQRDPALPQPLANLPAAVSSLRSGCDKRTVPERGRPDNQRAVGHRLRHCGILLTLSQHGAGLYCRTGFGIGYFVSVHDPQVQESEVAHCPRRRADIQRIAGPEQHYPKLVLKLIMADPEMFSHSAARYARSYRPRVHTDLRYWMETEVHVYAFSIAANVLLSFFPFLIVMMSICRYILHWRGAEQAILIAVNDYFPGAVGEFVARNLSDAVDRSPNGISHFPLFFTANESSSPRSRAESAWGITQPKLISEIRS